MAIIKNFSARYNASFKDITFSSNNDRLNISAITGANGSSKSSILRDIAIAALGVNGQINTRNDTPRSTYYESNEIQAEFLCGKPIKIVSASGSPFDRFPQKIIGGRATKYNSPNYTYLGQRIGTNLLSKKPVIELIAEKLLIRSKDLWRNPVIKSIFKRVGLLPQIFIEIRPRLINKAEMVSQRGLLDAIEIFVNSNGNFETKKDPVLRRHSLASLENILIEYDYDAFTDLDYFITKKPGRIKIPIDLEGVTANNINLDSLSLGLASGVLEVSSCDIVGYESSSPYSIYELSSGEYHWLTSMLGLYLTAQEESIVLVDEPENSLHPAWQSAFTSTLIDVCIENKVGQLIIGTHSPIIVSSLTESAEVINLSHNENKQNYYAKSVDDILLENFKMPSTRNFYFYNDLQNAINMYANNHHDSSEFVKLISSLCEYRKNLRNSDPAAEIIDFLSSNLH